MAKVQTNEDGSEENLETITLKKEDAAVVFRNESLTAFNTEIVIPQEMKDGVKGEADVSGACFTAIALGLVLQNEDQREALYEMFREAMETFTKTELSKEQTKKEE